MTESYNTNLINAAYCYLNALEVKITKANFKESLLQHPFFPSLYSISEVFERFGVQTEAYKVESEKLDALKPPFIAYLSGQKTGKDFVLVNSLSEREVAYISENNKIKRESKEEFRKNWEGIVLQAISTENSGENDFESNQKKELRKRQKMIALKSSAALILIASVYFFLHSLDFENLVSASTLILIKMAGLVTTILLLVYEVDKSNEFVKSICMAGKQTNCAAVLQGKSSKILGISWSEVGFFYFASTFLFLLFPGITFGAKVFVLSIANVLAASYILFSIYYQWKVAKQWCLMCLTVQAILLMELIWSIWKFWTHATNFSVEPFAFSLPVAYCILLPVASWFILKPLILKARDEPAYKFAYRRLLYNPQTFDYLLQQQPLAPGGYQNIGIELGNPNAENTIIKVCNPYCGPCAKAHPLLDEIVHHNKNVKLKLIFTASNDRDDKRGIAARHLLAIYKKNIGKTGLALNEWYLAEKKDYEEFAKKYPMNGELKQQEGEIEKMKEWCKEAEISFTPTIFINGRRLPHKYKIDELKYIL